MASQTVPWAAGRESRGIGPAALSPRERRDLDARVDGAVPLGLDPVSGEGVAHLSCDGSARRFALRLVVFEGAERQHQPVALNPGLEVLAVIEDRAAGLGR